VLRIEPVLRGRRDPLRIKFSRLLPAALPCNRRCGHRPELWIVIRPTLSGGHRRGTPGRLRRHQRDSRPHGRGLSTSTMRRSSRARLLAEHDFVFNDDDVEQDLSHPADYSDSHGTHVLSIAGGFRDVVVGWCATMHRSCWPKPRTCAARRLSRKITDRGHRVDGSSRSRRGQLLAGRTVGLTIPPTSPILAARRQDAAHLDSGGHGRPAWRGVANAWATTEPRGRAACRRPPTRPASCQRGRRLGRRHRVIQLAGTYL